MNYKIVFFDVDGTLTHHEDGSISSNTRTAIKRLKEKGIIVAAATGRPLSLCDDIRNLGIDTLITANGGYAKHHETVIHKVSMNQELLKAVSDFALSHNHGMAFFTEEFRTNGVKNIRILQALKETLGLEDYPIASINIHEEEVYLTCLYADEEAVEMFTHKFPQLTFSRWHPYIVNVLQEEVSKSRAILKVLDHFNIDPSEAIAFGDGENDIDMLELVGLGIAMGNGHDQLKRIADFVTKKSSEDGIYYALNELGII